MKQRMDANLFAQMFVEDIPETLDKEEQCTLFFDAATLNDDPELKILRKAVSEAGYSLTPTQDPQQVKFQDWILSK